MCIALVCMYLWDHFVVRIGRALAFALFYFISLIYFIFIFLFLLHSRPSRLKGMDKTSFTNLFVSFLSFVCLCFRWHSFLFFANHVTSPMWFNRDIWWYLWFSLFSFLSLSHSSFFIWFIYSFGFVGKKNFLVNNAR